MASSSLTTDGEVEGIGGNVTRFPLERARAPAQGFLPPDRQAHYVERARSFMHAVRHKDTGALLTAEEQERFAHEFVAAMERAAIEIERKR